MFQSISTESIFLSSFFYYRQIMYMDLFPSTKGDIYLSRSIVSIFSALTATGLALYCTNKLISRPFKKSQESLAYSKIPVPQGAYYYLGMFKLCLYE